MDGPRIRLKLVLDTLGISSDVSNLQNRINIQKAVFLAKQADIDLGYSYNWYIHGPYSPELTSDYYVLNNEISHGDSDYEEYELDPVLTPNLERTKHIIDVPSGVHLSKTDWLELISSIIYWQNLTKNEAETKRILINEKSGLCGEYERALARIKELGLFPS